MLLKIRSFARAFVRWNVNLPTLAPGVWGLHADYHRLPPPLRLEKFRSHQIYAILRMECGTVSVGQLAM